MRALWYRRVLPCLAGILRPMPQPLYFRFRSRPGLTGWARILIVLALIIALMLVIAIVAIGVFLFVLPVLAVSALVYYLLPRARRRSGRPDHSNASGGPQIIDGEFRVVDSTQSDRASLDDRTRGN
jgi:membrane protein implicated in regulation of membrane protease activity